MRVHIFESEPWIKSAWQATGTRLDSVWVEGLLTPTGAQAYEDAQIICSDVSILNGVVLGRFKQLKLIAARSTGVDQVDLAYCRSRNITVCNVPAYAQNAVAEHVFTLLLAMGRHVIAAVQRTRRLNFSWTGIQGFELCGKTLVVIGTGAIGKRVAMIAKGFCMEVVAVDGYPDTKWAESNKVRYLPLNEALPRADVVTLHVPGTPETSHLLSKESFLLMKDGVVVINTARGDIIDSRALLEALASGKVAGAGLDVLSSENNLIAEDVRLQALGQSRDGLETELANHLLLQHPRVMVTPHCAFFTREAASRLMEVTVGNIEAFIRGKPENIVI